MRDSVHRGKRGLAAVGLIGAAALVASSCGARVKSPTRLMVTGVTTASGDDSGPPEPMPPIRVRFNQPVVGEGSVGSRLSDPPVTLTPQVAFAAHWEDRETLVLKPTAPLAASTRYQVTLTGELGARLGKASYAFVNQPLVVSGVMATAGDGGAAGQSDLSRIATNPWLGLMFNQVVAPADVVKHCSLAPAEGETTIALKTQATQPDTTVRVTPVEWLAQDTAYDLVCENLAGAGGNAGLDEAYHLKLHTYPPLAVTEASPHDSDTPSDGLRIRVGFSNPVSLEDVRKHLTITPAVTPTPVGWLDATRTHYEVEVDLKTETEYKVALTPGVADEFGQAIKDPYNFEFTTGDARPRISMEKGIFAVEDRADGYPVWTRNVKQFAVACARVPDDKLVGLLTGAMDYDPWYGSGEDAEMDWKKVGLVQKDSKVVVGAAKNNWQLQKLKLSEVCGGPKGSGNARGVYLAEVESPEVAPDSDDRWGYRPKNRVLANVTNMGILLKAGNASGLAWVTGLSDGKPVADAVVEVYSTKGKKVYSTLTDGSGIARLPGSAELLKQPGADDKKAVETAEESEEDWDNYRSQRLVVLVKKGTDTAVVDGNWANGIQIWNFGVPEDRSGGLKKIRGFIQSDRGIYRPGETVMFKGIVRELEIGKLPKRPADAKIAVHVEDTKGSAIYDEDLPLTGFGGFSFDLPLSAEAPTGDYYVTATIGGQSFREKFMVEEFRKVEFELKVKGGPGDGKEGEPARVNQELAFSIDAQYLFGAPLPGASVKWSVMRRRHEVTSPHFPEYSFADDTGFNWDEWMRRWEHPLSFVTDGEGKTDAEGQLAVRFKDEHNEGGNGPQDYLLEATATDAEGQSVSKETAVTAHTSDFYIGMHSEEFVQAVGMPFGVNLVAIGPDGKQVAARAKLHYIQHKSSCTYSGDYRATPTCNTDDQELWSKDISIPASGSGTERIMPKHAGEFLIKVDSLDAHGNKVSTSSAVWIIGKEEAFWSGDESARMSVVSSKQAYVPGDTAKLVPQTALSAGTALVTLERNGILDAFVVNMQSSGEGIQIPIHEAHAPNVFASVAIVQGRRGDGDRLRPRFQMGVVDLPVSSEKQRLKVVVETDQASYQPGQKVTGKLHVTADGKPVVAELSVSVADEGVLQLIAYKTPDPMATFYAAWGLGIDSATSWNRIARIADPTSGDPDEGGDSGSDEGPKVRSKFVNSAFWAPALVTDKNGDASFTFKAPDNLTAFRVMAVGGDIGAKFGSGEKRFTVKKPLLAQPVLPRFLAPDDHAEVGVVVHNYTARAGVATVTARATGVELAMTKTTVKLAVGGSARVRFPAHVGFVDSATLRFDAVMDGNSDAVEMTLPVQKHLTMDAQTVSRSTVDASWSGPVRWPAGLVEQDSSLQITVDRSGMGELQPSLEYLIQYPYGCLEQTLSGLIPLVKVKDLAVSLHMKELEGPRLEHFIAAGVAKILRHQHEDGHFSLWPTSETYPHLTVYALYGLQEAKRAGVAVEAAPVERGLAAMRSWANSRERTLGPGGEAATVAMAAYVMADMGKADRGLNARLFVARKGLPVYGQAFLLSALKLGGGSAADITLLEHELLGHLKIDGGVATVKEDEDVHELEWYMSSDVRSTAITLSALVLVDPTNPINDQLARGLKDAQKPTGHWYNTQDNLYSLVALASWARTRTAGSLDVKVTLGDKTLAAKTLAGGEILSFRAPLSTLGGMNGQDLKIVTSGKAEYRVMIGQARRDAGKVPVAQGFAVTRQYLDPVTKQPMQSFKAGQLVKVKLTIEATQDRHWVAVVDPLPAGFEAVNDRLATSEQDPDAVKPRDWRNWSDDRWIWTNRELRDDRLHAFADHMSKGVHHIEYLVRATTPGTFRAAPASAEAMYEPDVFGHSVASDITVGQ